MNDEAIDREEGSEIAPQFDAQGLITAVVVRASDKSPLMVAHMNAEALRRTLETGEAWFWSRSRGELWHKGATSGQILTIREMRMDCDQDCVWLAVDVGGDGGCCHTGRANCFYRKVVVDPATRAAKLVPAA